jgi:hypothetical protein
MDNLNIFSHCYRNTVIIRSFIYYIYQQLKANFESYLTPQLPLIVTIVFNVFEVKECLARWQSKDLFLPYFQGLVD